MGESPKSLLDNLTHRESLFPQFPPPSNCLKVPSPEHPSLCHFSPQSTPSPLNGTLVQPAALFDVSLSLPLDLELWGCAQLRLRSQSPAQPDRWMNGYMGSPAEMGHTPPRS